MKHANIPSTNANNVKHFLILEKIFLVLQLNPTRHKNAYGGFFNVEFRNRLFKRVISKFTSQVLICSKVLKSSNFLVVFIMTQNTGSYSQ
jgi:hypothetical protein